MFRLRFMAPVLVVGMLGSGFLMGQDKKTDKEPIIVRVSLPSHYKDLNLSQKQKNQIYRIRGKSQAEIQELQQKINELKEQERADCENVLTADQLERYRQILLGANRKGKGGTKDAEAKMEKKNTGSATQKKDTVAKDKKNETEGKDKNAPIEIKK